MHHTLNPAKVCAVVLAGGRGSRMGSVDKGLQKFHGQTLVQHVVHRLRLQTAGEPGLIAVNANRNLPHYAAMGLPVWPDRAQDYSGPLAGFQTAFGHLQAQDAAHTDFDYLLTVPCDSPLLPLDLLSRLGSGLHAQNAELAVALAAQPLPEGEIVMRPQPVFTLIGRSLHRSLDRYLASGQRKIDPWLHQHRLAQVAFNMPHDDPHAFANANTMNELHALERL